MVNELIKNCPNRRVTFEPVVGGCPTRSASREGPSQQRDAGFSLVVSMLFLAVLTAVAVTAMQTSALDEKMAANTQHHDAAFLAAETGIGIGLRIAAQTALQDSWETVAAGYKMNFASNAYCDSDQATCGADWPVADTAALQITIEYIGDSSSLPPEFSAGSDVSMHHYLVRSEADHDAAATTLFRGFYRLGQSTTEPDPLEVAGTSPSTTTSDAAAEKLGHGWSMSYTDLTVTDRYFEVAPDNNGAQPIVMEPAEGTISPIPVDVPEFGSGLEIDSDPVPTFWYQQDAF